MFQQPNVYFLFGLSDGGFYFSCLNHKTDFVFAPSAPTWPYFLPYFFHRGPEPPFLCSGVGVRGTARHVRSLTRGNDQNPKPQNDKCRLPPSSSEPETLSGCRFVPSSPPPRLDRGSLPRRTHGQAGEGWDNETLWGQQSILSPLLVMLLSLCVKFPTKNTNFELGIWH